MAKYKVSYETSVRPADVPAGAVIEKVSALPLRIEKAGEGAAERRVNVQKSVYGDKAAWVQIEKTEGSYYASGAFASVHLTADEAVDLADALYEAAGRKPGFRSDYKIGDRVRLLEPVNSYVGSHVAGDTGEVIQGLDEDREIRVRFNGIGDDFYVKFYELASA